MKDYYDILGISPKASSKEIRERYRALVTSCHPDKFQDAQEKSCAEETIKGINQAYEILRDPQRRASYDVKRAKQDKKPAISVKFDQKGRSPYPRSIREPYRAPVTPITNARDPIDFTSTGIIPHIQERFYSRRGDLLQVWIDQRANVLLMDKVNYMHYLSGQNFSYLGGEAVISPVEIAIPASGHWRLVVDLGGLTGAINVKARIIPVNWW